jgi:putative molybdopterin biosynthesis protein
VRDLTDEVITATSARAEELFDELVDTLVKEDDPIGVACSLLIQLTRFVAEAGTIAEEPARDAKTHLADLVVIGSHCVGLDMLIGRLQSEGISVKALNVGSTGGLAAAKEGECDIAAIHLMDPETGEYNRPFLTPALDLIPCYRRLQGIVYRKGDARFEGRSIGDAIGGALGAPDCLMVNRNAGSGTRILTDRLLGGAKPAGYWSQLKSHNAVGVAIAQSRADWGIAIDTIVRQSGLGFIPVQAEHYDFIVPKARLARPAVRRFRAVLESQGTQDALVAFGFKFTPSP